MFLSNAQIGKCYTVTGMWLGKGITHRLEALGMTHGTKIYVINRKISGSVVIRIRGTRFALGRGFSQGISIREENK